MAVVHISWYKNAEAQFEEIIDIKRSYLKLYPFHGDLDHDSSYFRH